MTSIYQDFLASKRKAARPVGREIEPAEMHPFLHPFQRDAVAWAVRTGRAALWTSTGTGKTLMQVQWAVLSGDTALIVAPLAVAQQTVREAAKIDVPARYVRNSDEVTSPGVWVTNYEMTDRFDPAVFDAVVLDEASRIKDSTSTTRNALTRQFAGVPRKLTCTATPAPNDVEELTNQAEFLGVSTRVDMLATWFVHDDNSWRVKGHAREAMYRWMSTWALALRTPSDLGYPDGDYVLPGLSIVPHLLPVDVEAEGQLFATDLGGVGGRAKARRNSLDARVAHTIELVAAEPDEQWLIWCGLNNEADALTRAIPGAVNVPGAMNPDAKADALLAFADGQVQRLVTKPGVAGHGMNFQNAAQMVFCGVTDSFEALYQAIRRCYRYGQTRIVDVHIVVSDIESQIIDNVRRKEREHDAVIAGLVDAMRHAREQEVAA